MIRIVGCDFKKSILNIIPRSRYRALDLNLANKRIHNTKLWLCVGAPGGVHVRVGLPQPTQGAAGGAIGPERTGDVGLERPAGKVRMDFSQS